MAIIGGLVGGIAGGGLIGSFVTTAIGIGLNLAIAYFFPQKIKGPRAESLKAQTSRFGDHVARSYGTSRLAGAVIWLKGDQVDEHVRTYRQGKALGPEVTEYTYTATFAVALAWNGPFTAVPRIWADDKLIYDQSADSLQESIDTGGAAIGVAEGAAITIYLGSQTQQSDPNIEADRGAGNVPAYPGLCYIVVSNLPLDEFGIRVPNIEAEVVQTGDEVTLSYEPGFPSVDPYQIDTNGNYAVGVHVSNAIELVRMPSGAVILSTSSLSFQPGSVHITDRDEVLITSNTDSSVHVLDAATGAQRGTIAIPGLAQNALIDDISISGVTYALVWQYNQQLSLLSGSGTYSLRWTATTTYTALFGVDTFSMGPDYAYGVIDSSHQIVRVGWSAFTVTSEVAITIPEATDNLIACYYDDDSDSVVILDADGNLFVYTSDLGTLLRSNTSTGIGNLANADPMLSKRMKSGSDRIAVRSASSLNDIFEFRLSDLSLIRQTDASATTWVNKGDGGYGYAGFNETHSAAFPTGTATTPSVWFLPRATRAGVPRADVIEAECTLAGLPSDVSQVTGEIKGYAERQGSPPRAVIEDICRVGFVDFSHVDGITTFFMRKTSATRTLTVAETGLALNTDPSTVQVVEEYPAVLDVPEQVIISYQSWDAIYRMGAQSGTPVENQNFADEPTEADETGSPLKIRKKRPLEFSTAQVMTDSEAVRCADVIHRDLRDAATTYRTPVGPHHLDLYPGEVIILPLDDSRTATAVITKQSGETLVDLELRKRGDTFDSDAEPQPTPYVTDSLLGMAAVAPALIDGHLLQTVDDNDGFYLGVAVTSVGQFRAATVFRSEDGGSNYSPFASFANGMVRGFALDVLPDREHPDAIDYASEFTIAVPQGTAPDSITEEQLLASTTSNGFAVYNSTEGEWEYIRAATVVDNADGTWTLSTLLRGLKGTERFMAGHAIGDVVYQLDELAMARATEGDRTLARLYVAVASGTRFDSTGAVSFTNMGKGLRPWAPVLVSAVLDSGSGDWTLTWNRRDRLGQEWPEEGAEDPPLSEDTEEYTINFYDGGDVLQGTYTSSSESYVYSAADQTTDFGSPQTSLNFGIDQVSAIYGDGVELREAA